MLVEKTILLVDDDPHFTRVLRLKLENAGYVVESTWDGNIALTIIENLQPSLVISDLNMPNMDGFSLYEKLTSIPGLEDVPFIILSAAIDMETQQRLKKMERATFVSKPFSPRKLLELVNNLLSVEA